jgi:hypothetical protein
MGHTKCARRHRVVDGAHVTPNIAKLVDNIVPAAQDAIEALPDGQRSAARRQGDRGERPPRVGRADRAQPALEGAREGRDAEDRRRVYDLHTGQVRWIDATPSPAPVSPKQVDADAGHDAAPPAAQSDAHGEPPAAAHAPMPSLSRRGRSPEDERPRQRRHRRAFECQADPRDEHGDTHADAASSSHDTKVPARKDNFLASAACSSVNRGFRNAHLLVYGRKSANVASPSRANVALRRLAVGGARAASFPNFPTTDPIRISLAHRKCCASVCEENSSVILIT